MQPSCLVCNEKNEKATIEREKMNGLFLFWPQRRPVPSFADQGKGSKRRGTLLQPKDGKLLKFSITDLTKP